MCNLRNFIAGLALAMQFCSVAYAADIGWTATGFLIDGKIEAGDYTKFRKLVEQRSSITNVILTSPGGDLAESIRIGHLIRKLRFSTEAPTVSEYQIFTSEMLLGEFPPEELLKHAQSSNKNAPRENLVCASSCFLIFIAGVERSGNVLGIHRPYLSDEYLEQMTADEALDAGKYLHSLLNEYFLYMGFPSKYVDMSMEVPSTTIRWLDPKKATEIFGDAPYDKKYIPEFDAWLAARCPKFTDVEQKQWDRLGHEFPPNLTDKEKMLVEELGDKFMKTLQCKGYRHEEIVCEKWMEEFPATSQYMTPDICNEIFEENMAGL